jgi:hypothetical protein
MLLVRMDNAAYVASVELAPGKRERGAFQELTGALENALPVGKTKLPRQWV